MTIETSLKRRQQTQPQSQPRDWHEAHEPDSTPGMLAWPTGMVSLQPLRRHARILQQQQQQPEPGEARDLSTALSHDVGQRWRQARTTDTKALQRPTALMGRTQRSPRILESTGQCGTRHVKQDFIFLTSFNTALRRERCDLGLHSLLKLGSILLKIRPRRHQGDLARTRRTIGVRAPNQGSQRAPSSAPGRVPRPTCESTSLPEPM